MEIMSKRRGGASHDNDDNHHNNTNNDSGRLMLVTKKSDCQYTPFELELIVRLLKAVSDALKKVHDKKTASGHFYCMRIVSHFPLSTLAALE